MGGERMGSVKPARKRRETTEVFPDLVELFVHDEGTQQRPLRYEAILSPILEKHGNELKKISNAG
jgi:hypothetical protein